MISFISALAVLVLGYALYGRLTEKIFAPEDCQTPAITDNDGVDFMPVKTHKAVLIQLLNIAGTGPILKSGTRNRKVISNDRFFKRTPA